MKVSLSKLFWIFFKIGCILIGGGYVILPLLHDEFVKKLKWISEDELVDYYTMSQCLPGVIAANIAIFTGYKLKGIKGGIVSILGLTASPFIAIIIMAAFVKQIMHLPLINSFFWGVGIGVCVLIFSVAKELWGKGIVDKTSFFIFLSALILIKATNFSPVFILLFSALVGILAQKFKEQKT